MDIKITRKKGNADPSQFKNKMANILLSQLQEGLNETPCTNCEITTELRLEEGQIKFDVCCSDQEVFVQDFLDSQKQQGSEK
jgi:hypothetical protein